MPYSIARVPTDDPTSRHARSEEIRSYVEQKLTDRYAEQNPALLVDVVVARRSDYDEVKVFLTMPSLVNDAETFLRQLEQELAIEGVAVVTYVRTWTGPTTASV